jgi:hypothetical protein
MGFALSHANSRNQPASTSSRAPWFVLPLLLAAILGLEVAVWSDAKPSTATLTLEGQVVKLAELLKADDVQVDADAVPFVLALRTQDGKLLPIVKTLGSRALFQDGRLLNRPLQVRGRLAAGGSVLVIDRFYTLKNGVPHEVYYWCETCAIRRDYPEKGVCECCGGPMELREVPLPR